MKIEQNDTPQDVDESFSEESVVQNENLDSPQEKYKGKKGQSSALTEYLAAFSGESEAEKKIRLSLDFMRAALSQSGSPRFKDFWEGRKLCLPLFKENLTPVARAQLWAEYIELSAEARRLKEILDEQSVFAVEQIELAIQSIEKDLERYDQLLGQIPHLEFPESCRTLAEKKDAYNTLQRELYLLNTLASRVNALRKEIIKTEMRVRHKNKFFERLSLVGDRIFPQRKELIKKISDAFIEDVKDFVTFHFQEDDSRGESLYALREEIKALQGIAKSLTLNTHTFTETRLQLSECWDRLKRWEKERKKEFAERKQLFKQNTDLVLEKIKALAELCKTENASHEEVNKQSEEILNFMKTLSLGRDEVKMLKDELYQAKRPIVDKARFEEQEREKREKEQERQKRERATLLRQRIDELLQGSDTMDLEKLSEERDLLVKEYESLSLNKSEKQIFDRQFKQLRDAVVDKKEQAALQLSPDDLESLEQLKVLLQERKELRQEIKTQLENYRKALSGSGFDFEKAMLYRELLDTEKARLDKANAAILEIEEKISELEG